MRHLRTFEIAARLGSFSAAAEELNTTQSAVSRTVKDLERRLGTTLFERGRRGVRLTSNGERYREAVAAGLDRIGAAGATLTNPDSPVVIAANHSISSHFLLPLREDLYREVGSGAVHIHILTTGYRVLDHVNESEADIILSYDTRASAPEDQAVSFRQVVGPVCAPGYARAHSDVLARPAREWGGLTILRRLPTSAHAATWEDWFAARGQPCGRLRWLTYSDYLFLLEDAVAGKGLALGWRRIIDRHLEAGKLVAVGDGFVEVDRPHHAWLTERGRERPPARRCLEFFAELTRRADNAAPDLAGSQIVAL